MKNTGNCKEYRKLWRIQETVENTGNCEEYRNLERIQETVRNTGNCKEYRKLWRIQETLKNTGNFEEYRKMWKKLKLWKISQGNFKDSNDDKQKVLKRENTYCTVIKVKTFYKKEHIHQN